MTKCVKGIILAAGYSSRMGTLKSLLTIEGKTVIKRQIDCLNDAGVAEVITVCGYQSEKLMPFARAGSRVVHNPDFHEGMFTSMRAGILAAGSCDGLLLLPVDHVMVRPYEIKQLLAAFEQDVGRLYSLAYREKKAHPPLLPLYAAKELAAYQGEGGAKPVLQRFAPLHVCIPVYDPYIDLDIDTPEEFQRALDILRNYTPNREACLSLLQAERTPKPVVRHCERVANTAVRIAEEMNWCGAGLDIAVLFAAALLHDVRRTQPHHAQAGAQVLLQNGFPRLAELVRVHMMLPQARVEAMREDAVLYLADKLTYGDQTVTLQKRRLLCMANERRARFMEEHLQKAQRIQRRVEELTGKPVEQICGVC